MFDRRGAGRSDPIVEPVTLEGGAMACMLAGTHPERTAGPAPAFALA